jgi:hypothetical protein
MAKEEANKEKKIIIDEDWKTEARKEKEILAAQEQAEEKKKEQTQRHGPLPKGNLPALISMLATQTVFALGLLQVEGQEDREPDLELARYNIDMLETLEAKTKGNLTKAEEKALKDALHELRMGYVKVAERLAPKNQ